MQTIWFTTRMKLLIFESKILRKIHGPVRNQNVEYERWKNDEPERLYYIINQYRIVPKAKRLERAGHGESVIRNVLTRNPTKKRPRGRPRQRCLDRIKKDISETDESKRWEDVMDWNGEMYGKVWLKRTKGLYSIN